jgi:hypothetical protein
VCKKWNSFVTFNKWAISHGYADDLQIDRKNNNGNYSPFNCRFVTCKVNQNNRRDSHYIIAFGEKKTVKQWSEDYRCKIKYDALRSRIRDNRMNPEEAITKPSLTTTKTSKYKGVSYRGIDRVYEASIKINKKYKYLGRFFSERSAAAMHNVYAYLCHGDKAVLNDLRLTNR